jgi:TRAP-type transport system small permease protein
MEKYYGFVNVIHKISYYFSWFCGIILFLMMAITFIDVVGRYVFNKPLIGAAEILEQLLVVFIFCVLAQVTVNREHIRADIITSLLSNRNRAIAGAISMSIAFISTILMTIAAGFYDGQTNFQIVTGIIRMPIAPFYYIATIGLTFCCFEMLFDIIRYVIEARGSSTVEKSRIIKAEQPVK